MNANRPVRALKMALNGISLLLALGTGSGSAQAAESELQRGSGMSGDASGKVIAGSGLLLVGGSYLVVVSVSAVAEGVVVVLKSASQAGEVSIRLSGKALDGVSTLVGSTVKVVAIASGTVLVVSGQVLAFIPNEIGKALLYHAPVSKRGAT